MFRSVVFCIVCAAAALMLAAERGTAAEINVPADHKTIQAAIEASQDGDVVIVSAGTYPEHINFLGKAITVRSADPDDPDVVAATIIDGGGDGSCVTFENDEGPDSVLAGMTVTNGSAPGGGGIYCWESSPTIQDNVVTENSADLFGGGIGCDGGSPMIRDNVIVANDVVNYGGGICCWRSSPTVQGNLVTENSARVFGGGIACDGGSPMIRDNAVIANAAGSGGGVSCRDSSPVISNNTISAGMGNTGAGVSCVRCSGGITNNRIIGNTATGHFRICGGIYIDEDSSTLIANNVIAENSAGVGAGIYAGPRLAVIIGNTVSANIGLGVWIWETCTGVVEGNAIVDNTGGGIDSAGSTATIVGNKITGNGRWGGIRVSGQSPIIANNLIAGNTGRQGGGIQCSDTSAVIANNTIVNNRATEAGGGVYSNCRTWPPNVTNCIVRNNTAELGAQIAIETIESTGGPVPCTLRIDRSDVEGGRDAAYIDEGCTLIWDEANIDADPEFIEPGHWDDRGTPDDPSDDEFILGDYRLLPGSPCIDAGTNDVDNPDTEPVEELPETDFAGLPRIIDGDLDGAAVVDMGAYEYLPGDVNYDGKVNVLDLIFIRNNLGADPASVPAARQADLNADGKVDILDLTAARNQIERR